MHLNMSFEKQRPFRLGLNINVLKGNCVYCIPVMVLYRFVTRSVYVLSETTIDGSLRFYQTKSLKRRQPINTIKCELL